MKLAACLFSILFSVSVFAGSGTAEFRLSRKCRSVLRSELKDRGVRLHRILRTVYLAGFDYSLVHLEPQWIVDAEIVDYENEDADALHVSISLESAGNCSIKDMNLVE